MEKISFADISRLSIEERIRLEEKLVKMIIDKRPYYKTVRKLEVVEDTVSDLLDVLSENEKAEQKTSSPNISN